jgi:hypothetical protein
VKFRKNTPAAKTFGLLVFALWLMNVAVAQESSPNPASEPASAKGPSAALRDVLTAACSQSQNDFSRFLTARNKESFSHMTPAARVAFMKRFVLLNEAGKPSVSANPSGRPIVRCDTPAGAAEIQIGGADTRDNIAFLPVDLRDATDSSGASAIQVNMGMVRENGDWKILSLGLVLLDLPSLELEWDSAEADKNEQAAIESLKTIAEAVEAYRRKFTRLPDSLGGLGPPLHGPVGAEAAGLLEPELAQGMKNGYSFRYVIVGGSGLGAPAKFELAATPVTYGRTGHRSFFRDAVGTLRGADRQGAVGTSSDPRLP